LLGQLGADRPERFDHGTHRQVVLVAILLGREQCGAQCRILGWVGVAARRAGQHAGRDLRPITTQQLFRRGPEQTIDEERGARREPVREVVQQPVDGERLA
jgi:hypothetical protein